MGDKLVYKIEGKLSFEIYTTDENSFKLVFPKGKSAKEIKEIASAVENRKVDIMIENTCGIKLSIKTDGNTIVASGKDCKELFRILDNLDYIASKDHINILKKIGYIAPVNLETKLAGLTTAKFSRSLRR